MARVVGGGKGGGDGEPANRMWLRASATRSAEAKNPTAWLAWVWVAVRKMACAGATRDADGES